MILDHGSQCGLYTVVMKEPQGQLLRITPSNSPSRYISPKSDRFIGLAIDKFLLSNSVCWVTPYRASQSSGLPSHDPSRLRL